MRYAGLTGRTYGGKSLNAAGDRCINMYPETVRSGEETSYALLNTPGTTLFANVATADILGIYVEPATGRLFSVGISGTPGYVDLWEIHSDGTSTLLINYQGGGQITFASNGKQMFVANSGVPANAKVYELATGAITNLVVGAGSDFLGALDVRMIDNYFICRIPSPNDPRKFQISAPLDGTSWNAANIGIAEGGPDAIIGTIDSHREYWMFGSKRAEIFIDTGASPFPFERINSVAIEQGCAAAQSIVKLDSQIYWLGENEAGIARVFRADGYTPTGVSTREVEWWFNEYKRNGSISDAIAYGYQDERGHSFYVITFPSVTCEPDILTGKMTNGVVLGAQWAYDITENQWHERQHYQPSNNKYGAALGLYYAFAFGKHIVGGNSGFDSSGLIFEASLDTGNDYELISATTVPISRIRKAPEIVDDLDNIVYSQFELSCQIGNVAPNDPNSSVELRVSNDGGLSWSKYYSKTLGSAGLFPKRLRWRALGSSRRRTFELSTKVNASVKWLDAFIKGRKAH